MTKEERIQKSIKKLISYNSSSKVKLRAKATRIHGYSIYFDYSMKGQRTYDFLNLYITGDATHDSETLAQALEIRKLKEADLAHQAAGFRVNTWQRKSDVVEYIREAGKKRTHAWACVARALQDFHPGTLRFMDLTQNIIEDFREYLLEKYSQNTAWVYLNTFKTALNQAVKDSIIVTNPAQGISVKKLETERAYLTHDELDQIKNTECRQPEVKRAFLFACYSGLRISDIARLDWRAIDLDKGTISTRQKKTNAMLYVPLLPMAQKLIGEPSTGLVFDMPSDSFVNRELKIWAASAGIDKSISFHSSRHTYAILAIEAGIEINVIQKLLGHSIISTTMVYAKVHDKALFQAADKFNKYLGE